jgi:hypothetical protein
MPGQEAKSNSRLVVVPDSCILYHLYSIDAESIAFRYIHAYFFIFVHDMHFYWTFLSQLGAFRLVS